MSLVYRPGTVADHPAMLELYAASYGKTFTREWLEWWNLRGPNGHNRVALVEDDEERRLAGAYGLLPVRLWLNGQEVKGSLCTNVCVHPDAQGQGIFTKLGRYALGSEIEHATPVAVGMPNAKALPGHLKVGWEVPGMLPLLAKERCHAQSHPCVEVGQYDERVDALVERIKHRYAFMVLRPSSWLNWRYSKPGTQYTRFALEDGLQVLGYVVCKHFAERSHIVDLHAESLTAFRALVAAAEDFAQGRMLTLWTNANDPYREWFLEAGYQEQATTDRIIVHTNYGPVRKLNAAGWDFPLGVNDVV